jgi:hypothetical protein
MNIPLTKAGRPDMRYKVNRDLFLPPKTNMDGSRDMRFR